MADETRELEIKFVGSGLDDIKRQVKEVREDAEGAGKAIAGGASGGNRRPPRTAAAASPAANDPPDRGTYAGEGRPFTAVQERRARAAGFGSAAEQLAINQQAREQFAADRAASSPGPQRSVPPNPTASQAGSPPTSSVRSRFPYSPPPDPNRQPLQYKHWKAYEDGVAELEKQAASETPAVSEPAKARRPSTQNEDIAAKRRKESADFRANLTQIRESIIEAEKTGDRVGAKARRRAFGDLSQYAISTGAVPEGDPLYAPVPTSQEMRASARAEASLQRAQSNQARLIGRIPESDRAGVLKNADKIEADLKVQRVDAIKESIYQYRQETTQFKRHLADEKRVQGERVAAVRESASIESELFQTGISGLSRRQQIKAISRRMGGMSSGGGGGGGDDLPPGPDDPNFHEYNRLQRQKENLQNGGFFGRGQFNRRAQAYLLLGAYDIAQGITATRRAEAARNQALTRDDYQNADIAAVRAGTSGVFGSIIGGALDLFGVGPESLSDQIKSGQNALNTFNELRDQKRNALYGRQITDSLSTHAPAARIEVAAIQARQKFDQISKTINDELGSPTTDGTLLGRLNEKSWVGQVRVDTLLSKPHSAEFERDLKAYRNRHADYGFALVDQYEDALQGPDREAVQNRANTLKSQLEQASSEQRASREEIEYQRGLLRSQLRANRDIAEGVAGGLGTRSQAFLELYAQQSVERKQNGITDARYKRTPYTQEQKDILARQKADEEGLDRKLSAGERSDASGVSAVRDKILGYARRAALEKVDSDFSVHRDSRGQIDIIGTVSADKDPTGFAREREKYDVAVLAATIESNQQEILQRGGIAASRAQLGRDPYGARRIKSAADTMAALQGKNLFSPDAIRILTQGMLDQQLINQEQADAKQDIGLSQRVRSRQLDSLFSRRPVGAQAYGIAGQATQEARDLARNGFTEESLRSLELGRRQLDLTKRDYLESFRGTPYDIRNLGFSARDKEDVAGTIGDINKAKTALTAETINQLADAFAKAMKTLMTD